MTTRTFRTFVISALFLGVLLTGFVDCANADLIGHTHTVTKGGGVFDSSFEYGIENKAAGNSHGATAFESTGGSGQNFFVFFSDNSANTSSNTLQNIGGGINWGASGLAAAFPFTAGMTAAPIVTALIPGVDRDSALYPALTTTAPNGGLFIDSWNADSFTLGVLSGVAIDNGATVGYQIELQGSAVPEPSSLALIGLGLFGCVLRRRRRAVLA